MESGYIRYMGGIDLITNTLQRTGCGQVTQEQFQGSKEPLVLLEPVLLEHSPGRATTTREPK